MSEEEKEEVESILAKLMDNLPEIEGLIAFNMKHGLVFN